MGLEEALSTTRAVRILFVFGFAGWALWGFRHGWTRRSRLIGLALLIPAWFASNAPLARIYGLVIPGDRQRNLSWAMSAAAGNPPFENSTLGSHSIEPLFSFLVALVSGFEPERVWPLYPFASLAVLVLVAVVVYVTTERLPSELPMEIRRQRAVLIVFFVVMAATPALDYLGPYRGYWPKMFLLKPNHALGLVLIPAFIYLFSQKKWLASALALGLLGWVFVMHWGFIGLALGLYLVWNGVRRGGPASEDSRYVVLVGIAGFLLVFPWLYRIVVQFPAAVIFEAGWRVATGVEKVGVSNWGDALPRGSSLLFLATLDQGVIWWLGLFGAYSWYRRGERQDRLWLCCLVTAYGLFGINYLLYLRSTARGADEIYFFAIFCLSMAAGEGAFGLYRWLQPEISKRVPRLKSHSAVFSFFLLAWLPLALPYWWQPPKMDAHFREALVPVPQSVAEMGAWLREHTEGKDVVIAADRLAHWAPTLSGRRVTYLQVDLRDALSALLLAGSSARDCGLPVPGIAGRRVILIWDDAFTEQLGLSQPVDAHPCWDPLGSVREMRLYEWHPSRRLARDTQRSM